MGETASLALPGRNPRLARAGVILGGSGTGCPWSSLGKRKILDELVCVLNHFARVHLFCDLMDCSPPGSSVHGILQARILEWVAMPSSRGSSPPRG